MLSSEDRATVGLGELGAALLALATMPQPLGRSAGRRPHPDDANQADLSSPCWRRRRRPRRGGPRRRAAHGAGGSGTFNWRSLVGAEGSPRRRALNAAFELIRRWRTPEFERLRQVIGRTSSPPPLPPSP